MPDKSSRASGRPDGACCGLVVQRAVLALVLRVDRPGRWSRAQLEREIADAEPAQVNNAIAVLEHNGVVEVRGEAVCASRCARYLDCLEGVSIS
jgi:hypothetical protein